MVAGTVKNSHLHPRARKMAQSPSLVTHPSSNNTMPPNTFPTVLPTRYHTFIDMGLWRLFHSNHNTNLNKTFDFSMKSDYLGHLTNILVTDVRKNIIDRYENLGDIPGKFFFKDYDKQSFNKNFFKTKILFFLMIQTWLLPRTMSG